MGVACSLIYGGINCSSCCFQDLSEEHQNNFSVASSASARDFDKYINISKELFTAVYYGRKKTLERIISTNTDKDLLCMSLGNGLNALHVAAMRGNLGCVQLLCSRAKFDVNRLDELDRTALAWAARNKHIAVYKYLKAKTQLSRLPDVYGFCASQYLCDENSEDESSPSLQKLLDKCEGKHFEQPESVSQLSLHTVSLSTTPTSPLSNTSSPLDHLQSRLLFSNTSSLSDCSPLHSNQSKNSGTSMDINMSFSPPLSPLEKDEDNIICTPSFYHSRENYNNKIAKRRENSLVTFIQHDIVTIPSDDSVLIEDMSCENGEGAIISEKITSVSPYPSPTLNFVTTASHNLKKSLQTAFTSSKTHNEASPLMEKLLPS